MKSRIISVALLLFYSVSVFIPFSALFATTANAESGQALSISPPLLELKADPGQSTTATIKLTNISAGDLLIKTQINDFGAKNETGEPNIIFDDTQSTSYGLRHWVESPAPFRLASKESKSVNFKINVPTDAEPGGHYAVFRFTGTAPELEESGVALSASIGSLVLMKVSGDIQEKASIAEFYSANANFAKQWLFENGPIGFVERINNEGNTHIQPTGTVEVFDIFGRKVSSMQVNGDPNDTKNQPKSILPKSIRRFEQTLNKYWMFGPYTAKLNLTYGTNKTALSQNINFWVIPYKLILLIIVLAVLLFFLIRWLNRRYKARIIKQAQKQHQLELEKDTTANHNKTASHSTESHKAKQHKPKKKL